MDRNRWDNTAEECGAGTGCIGFGAFFTATLAAGEATNLEGAGGYITLAKEHPPDNRSGVSRPYFGSAGYGRCSSSKVVCFTGPHCWRPCYYSSDRAQKQADSR